MAGAEQDRQRGRRSGGPRSHRGGPRGGGDRAPAPTAHRGDRAALRDALRARDGRPYPAYKDLRGTWDLSEDAPLTLIIDHVQGDPYAAPSRVRLRLPTGISAAQCAAPDSRVAAEDWLLRRFVAACRGAERRGSGRSGALEVQQPGPEIRRRSAVVLGPEGTVELRLAVGLPARGRRILGREAAGLLLDTLPAAVATLRAVGAAPGLQDWIRSVTVQRQLRRGLRARGLVAFVADGAVLPRASGVAAGPLAGAVPFQSPPALATALPTIDGDIVGMGIPEGVTVIAGGGFHGKSTLLHALQEGHLDHVPGDGRERVVADPDAVKIRAEDGRCVHAVDVSPFLGTLPGGRPTRPLSTADASGSTSQAAALVEAVQGGARVLLFDEDSCATNLMVGDPAMHTLLDRVAADQPAGTGAREPITPLVQRVRQLHAACGVSSVLVIGGVAGYLAVADTVLVMLDHRAHAATDQARGLAPPPPDPGPWPALLGRQVDRASLAPGGRGRVRARDARHIEYGDDELILTGIDQISDADSARTLGHALRTLATRPGPPTPSLGALLDELAALLAGPGLDALSPHSSPIGGLAAVRRHELVAVLGRLRSARLRPEEPQP